jgi:hypothetical protein
MEDLCALHPGTTSIIPSFENILVLMAYKAASSNGDSCSNVNVTLKLRVSWSQSLVSLHITSSKYQFFGIVSNVCINRCVHSSFGNVLHIFRHCKICSVGSPSHVYLCTMYSSLPNLICSNFLHFCQYSIRSLCTTYHLAGVAFKMMSNAKNLYCFGTCNSHVCTNVSISINPSYLGGSHNSIAIQCTNRVMFMHPQLPMFMSFLRV